MLLNFAGSKRLAAEPSFPLSCEVAIRPSFCWNSHQDTWQAGGVWSQFESGLKSCQADVCACTNFMGHKDAAFAGLHRNLGRCLSATSHQIAYACDSVGITTYFCPLSIVSMVQSGTKAVLPQHCKCCCRATDQVIPWSPCSHQACECAALLLLINVQGSLDSS